jgi:hypothetical protein
MRTAYNYLNREIIAHGSRASPLIKRSTMHVETATVELVRRFPRSHIAARFTFITGAAALDLAASIGVDPQVRNLDGIIARPIDKVRRQIATGRLDLDSVVLPVAFRL